MRETLEPKQVKAVRGAIYPNEKQDNVSMMIEFNRDVWQSMGSPQLVKVGVSHNAGVALLTVSITPSALRGDGVFTVGDSTKKTGQYKRVQVTLPESFTAALPDRISIAPAQMAEVRPLTEGGSMLVLSLNTIPMTPEPEPEPEPRLPEQLPLTERPTPNEEMVKITVDAFEKVAELNSVHLEIARDQVAQLRRIANGIESVAASVKSLGGVGAEATVELTKLNLNVREVRHSVGVGGFK